MPAARQWPLDQLLPVLAAYPQRSHFALALNWCLLPGINDRPVDADGIAGIVATLGRCMINVIPYNPGSQPIAPAPTVEQIAQFQDLLLARGLPVRVRSTQGRSIMAACGQLGRA
jgi:23S rRNA (adenine2503-C2)-methyltransferase